MSVHPAVRAATCALCLQLAPAHAAAAPFVEMWQQEDFGLEGMCDNILYKCDAGEAVCSEGACADMTCDCDLTEAEVEWCAPPPRFYTFGSNLATCAASFPNTCLDVLVGQDRLAFHGEDMWTGTNLEGFPLITEQRFDASGYISAEIEMQAYCGTTNGPSGPKYPRCFAGLTIYNGEPNYREIAYTNELDDAAATNKLDVWRYGPCEPEKQRFARFDRNTPHRLRLDYFGHEGGKWAYYIDDVPQRMTDLTHVEFAELLTADPRVGLFFVGWHDGEYVEGKVGPLRVWSGLHDADTQPLGGVWHLATNFTEFAQQTATHGAQNLTMVQLDLKQGIRYIVAAHADAGGFPGAQLASAEYVADHDGPQDVPLWVSAAPATVWLLIKVVNNSPGALLGFSPGSTHAGKFLHRTNNGPWQTLAGDLQFRTRTRM